MSSFKEFQRRRQSAGTPVLAPRQCCACGERFNNDADPERNALWDAITCPFCNFRQRVAWSNPLHFQHRTKQVKFAAQSARQVKR